MGVPGLWRILDTASSPLNLEHCSGLRIAIDINSHLNRILHGNHGGNWLFYVMKDLFAIMHYNIRVIIVFQGKKPVEKMFSSLLGDDNGELSYTRAISALMRASAGNEPSQRVVEPEVITAPVQKEKIATRTEQEIKDHIPRKEFKIPSYLQGESDPVQYSVKQLNRIAELPPPKQVATIVRPQVSAPIMLIDKNAQTTIDRVQTTKKIAFDSPKKKTQFKSSFLDSIKDIIQPMMNENDSEEEDEVPVKKKKKEEEVETISLEPADNPYLAPSEDYVTGEHVRQVKGLLDVLDVPYILAPEEATAECARLEMQGIVDACASDDNNTILFGSRWLIRNIFLNPHSITLKSLENVGLTRRRLINLAMMIDGDYNNDIRRRLFTVGPIRGLEILSFFPHERLGLFQFKEWWIRVVKNNGDEPDAFLHHFSKSKWLRKLLVPADFPPENLMKAFIAPTISNADVKTHIPHFNPEDVVDYVRDNSAARLQQIQDYVKAFTNRSMNFYDSMIFMKWKVNELNIPANMKPYFDTISAYHKKATINYISDDEDDDEKNKETDSEESDHNKSTNDRIVLTPELRMEYRKEAAQIRRETDQNRQPIEDSSDDPSVLLAPPQYAPQVDFISSSDNEGNDSVVSSQNKEGNDDESGFDDVEDNNENKDNQKQEVKTNEKEINNQDDDDFEDVDESTNQNTNQDEANDDDDFEDIPETTKPSDDIHLSSQLFSALMQLPDVSNEIMSIVSDMKKTTSKDTKPKDNITTSDSTNEDDNDSIVEE